jgi:putative intracellular protease/amidase
MPRSVTLRVLFVLTSHSVLGGTSAQTGFHLGEAVEPWQALRAAGYTVDFASVQGGQPPMVGYDANVPAQTAFLSDPAVADALCHTPVAAEVDPRRYDGIYFVGGHGTMWDFRDPALSSLARDVYEGGGVVAAICHGSAALVDVHLTDGRHFLDGHRVTAFSRRDEAARGLSDVVPFCLQSTLESAGAIYSCAPDRVAHIVVSDRLVTGQNPASASKLGERMVAVLQGQSLAGNPTGSLAGSDRLCDMAPTTDSAIPEFQY